MDNAQKAADWRQRLRDRIAARPRTVRLNPIETVGYLPRAVLEECLETVLSRVRWYEGRGIETPPQTLLALNHLCRKLGTNPEEL